jgi:DNA-binding transcriptional MerR regulator
MLRIGEFSKMSHVPVSTLRYYDEIGLLKPAHVDRHTGYRYYSEDQMSRLEQILVLKDLGLSLEQIARMLDEDLSPAHIRGMLRLKQVEIQRRLEEDQAQLTRVKARLKQMEEASLKAATEEGDMPLETRFCPECGKEIRETAIGFCPHCGAGLSPPHAPLLPIQKPAIQVTTRSIGLLLAAIGLIVIISGFVYRVAGSRRTPPSFMSGPLSESQPATPQLALLSVQSEIAAQEGCFVFEGEVKNISDRPLHDIVVAVILYDATPQHIASEETPIELTILQPAQTSPFSVLLDYNPMGDYYKVVFKHPNGEPVPTKKDL